MTDHLDLDTLADALTDPTAGQPHLGGCAACSSRLGELRAAEDDVRASLAALPVPTVPDHLVDRIAAALAAEAPGRAIDSRSRAQTSVDPSTTGPTGSATVTPLRRPRRNWRPAVAAGVVLLGIGGLGYAVVTSGGSSENATASSGAAPAAASAARPVASYPTSQSGTDYASRPAAGRALAGVLAGNSQAFSTGREASAPAARPSGLRVEPFSGAAGSGPASSPGRATDLSSGHDDAALERLRDPQALAGCLEGLDLGSPALALDYARYQTKPALAVVAADPDPGKVAVYVVGPACAKADPALLLFTRLDRPA